MNFQRFPMFLQCIPKTNVVDFHCFYKVLEPFYSCGATAKGADDVPPLSIYIYIYYIMRRMDFRLILDGIMCIVCFRLSLQSFRHSGHSVMALRHTVPSAAQDPKRGDSGPRRSCSADSVFFLVPLRLIRFYVRSRFGLQMIAFSSMFGLTVTPGNATRTMKKVGFPYKEHRPQFGWLAGWLAAWLAGGLAGWLAGWLAGGLAGW